MDRKVIRGQHAFSFFDNEVSPVMLHYNIKSTQIARIRWQFTALAFKLEPNYEIKVGRKNICKSSLDVIFVVKRCDASKEWLVRISTMQLSTPRYRTRSSIRNEAVGGLVYQLCTLILQYCSSFLFFFIKFFSFLNILKCSSVFCL